MRSRRIAKNFILLTLGEIVSRGINFISIVYLARILADYGFGILSFAQAFLVYLALIVDSGLTVFGTRELSKDSNKINSLFSNLLFIRISSAIVLFLASALVVWSIPMELQMKIILLGTFLMLFPMAIKLDWLFQGIEKMGFVAMARIIQSAISLLLIIFLVKNISDIALVPMFQFFGAIVSVIFYFIVVAITIKAVSILKEPDMNKCKKYLKEAIPLGVSFILIQIYYNLDTIMLGFMDKIEVVGWYSAVYKLIFLSLAVLSLFQMAAFPSITKLINLSKEKAQDFLEKYAKIVMFATVPTVLMVMFFAGPIISVIYGNKYLGGTLAFQILIWNLLIIGINSIYGSMILVPLGKQKIFMYAVGVGAVVNIVLNFILIPHFSLNGAAVATLITEIIVTILLLIPAYKIIKINFGWYLFKPILFSIIAIYLVNIVGLWMPWASWYLLIKLTILFLVYFSIYLALLLTFGEKEFIVEFIDKILLNRSEEY